MGLECEGVRLMEVKFASNELMEQFSSDLPVEITPEYGTDEDGDYHLMVTVEVGGEASRYPFSLKCVMDGIFSFEEDLYEEEQEQLILSEGLGIVMSFVRNYVYRLTEDAGYDPLILPTPEIE